MSIGLPNAKFNVGQPTPRLGLTSRKHKVTTSIAEQAVFIPKPHKRVKFKINRPEPALMGANGRSDGGPIPLPGSGRRAEANVVDSLKRGELGPNGLTARFNKSAWSGKPAGYVEMEVDYTPSKQNEVIVTQEEGRQVNNRQVHFTQQYDAYGRPRIGFSREPYDFAATKYISTTSQIEFQANMARMHEDFDKYLLNGSGGQESEADVMGADEKERTGEIPIFGATFDPASGNRANEMADKLLGADSVMKTGPKNTSAEESFEAQRIEIVDVFGKGDDGGDKKGPGASDGVAETIFGGGIDPGSVKILDVSV